MRRSNVTTIMKKEFARFFGDKRMLITLFLPGILIFVLYTIMGSAMTDMLSPDPDIPPTVYVVDIPHSLEKDSLWSWCEIMNAVDQSMIKQQISDKQADLLIVFPADFDEAVARYDVTTKLDAPNIELYYNPLEISSSNAYAITVSILDSYEATLANKFDLNRDIDGNLATPEELSASIISMLMPMLIITFLFSGTAGIGTESIAGEKERGTLGTLLVSPLKRSELALGKILSLAILSFLIGLVSSVSTILSLPRLIGATDAISVDIYTVKEYILLALVILSTLLLLVSLVTLVSAFAKSVKEASTAIMPLMIVVMVIGVSGMFGSASSGSWFYLIPIYNSVESMSALFALDYSSLNVVLAVISNVIYCFIASFILAKMFNNEKVIFSG